MERNNFDLVAPFYDRLSSLVFGESITESQHFLMQQCKKGTDVLVLGGGTGKLLQWVPQDCSVLYLEKSRQMIDCAKGESRGLDIHFVNQDFFTWKNEKEYDFIICPFFLDCFHIANLKMAIEKCRSLLKANGKLLVAEFDKSTTNRVLSFLMHLFFRAFSNLESRNLLDIHQFTLHSGFILEKEEFFHRRSIFSRVYGISFRT